MLELLHLLLELLEVLQTFEEDGRTDLEVVNHLVFGVLKVFNFLLQVPYFSFLAFNYLEHLGLAHVI